MKRRSSSRKPAKARRTTKLGSALKARRRPDSSVADLQAQIERQARELEEAREREAAASEVLRVISSSPGELDPVFSAMLENATRICGANFGGMFRFENATVRIIAKIGLPQKFFEALQRSDLSPGATKCCQSSGQSPAACPHR